MRCISGIDCAMSIQRREAGRHRAKVHSVHDAHTSATSASDATTRARKSRVRSRSFPAVCALAIQSTQTLQCKRGTVRAMTEQVAQRNVRQQQAREPMNEDLDGRKFSSGANAVAFPGLTDFTAPHLVLKTLSATTSIASEVSGWCMSSILRCVFPDSPCRQTSYPGTYMYLAIDHSLSPLEGDLCSIISI